MLHKENFICLSYGFVDYIIPKSDVYTAFICDSTNLITDKKGNNKVSFLSQEIPCFNFDKIHSSSEEQLKQLQTCIVIKNNEYKKELGNKDYFGIITTAECKVRVENLDIFSVLPDFYSIPLKEKGIVACELNKTNSRNNRIGYLIDISKFIKNALESTK